VLTRVIPERFRDESW